MLEIYEIVVDSLIMVLSAFAARTFWKTYRGFGNIRNLFMALVLLFLAALKAFELIAVELLGHSKLTWIHDPYIFNFIWLIMLAIILANTSRAR